MARELNDSLAQFVKAGRYGVRPYLKWASALISLCCLAAVIWHCWSSASGRWATSGPGGPLSDGNTTQLANAVGPSQDAVSGSRDPNDTGAAPAPNLTTPGTPQVPVDPAIGALVAGLKQLTGTNPTLTSEAAGAWRTNFANLVQTGSPAVPALREFLDQRVDYPFSQEAWQDVGYSSARLAAIDALRQIGGTDAVDVMAGLLTATRSPKEVALLAQGLEEASPGQYRGQALSAAQAGLTTALTSRNPETDVAPLFEVLQRYGDASVVPQLEKASGQWGYYATIALANMPDNAGLASVLRMADPTSNSGNQMIALEMVAQLAASSPEARQFLTTHVANNAIAPSLWNYLSGPLSGDQYYPADSVITPYPQLQSLSDLKTTHVGIGNQNLYTLPGDLALTPDGIEQRLALLDQLLQATSDPTAQQALQQARARLIQRSTRLAAQTPAAPEQ